MTRLGVIVCSILLVIICFFIVENRKTHNQLIICQREVDRKDVEREELKKSQVLIDSLAFYIPKIYKEASKKDSIIINIDNEIIVKRDTIIFKRYPLKEYKLMDLL